LPHQHRSAHPDDKRLFSGGNLDRLTIAIDELCWLLDRGYARHSAIQLVGDHHQLTNRQRLAVARAACSYQNRQLRDAKQLAMEAISGQKVVIDGFNLIITLEAAMAGGLILRCRDGCIRDLASVHGTYHQVEETKKVLALVGQSLACYEPSKVLWLFDSPISNSGRLAQQVKEMSKQRCWNWQAELYDNPDKIIAVTDGIAVTSDSAILDKTNRWVNLADYLVKRYVPFAWILELAG
jgi:hypothetical protein